MIGMRIAHDLRHCWHLIKRWRYERWARAFAAKHNLPFEGIMMLGGYKP